MTATVPTGLAKRIITGTISGGVIASRFEYALTTSAEFTTAGDTVAMGVLPAGHKLIDAILECTDIDTGSPAVTIDVGKTAALADIISASTIGQAGGMARAAVKTYLGWAVDDVNDTNILISANVPPATDASGTVALTLFYIPKPQA